jgi:hypothetical protein
VRVHVGELKKMQNKRSEEITLITLILFLIAFFLYGFFSGENSAGGGLLTGDFVSIWGNLQIFLNNDLNTAIMHEEYMDSRSPIAYIVHKFLNPFTEDVLSFRISVFCISLLLPLVFFFAIKKKFFNNGNFLLIFISTIILISPFYRTTSYWGLQENYGLIFLVLTYLFFYNFHKDIQVNSNKFLSIFLICLFSSLTFYFDQKLLIIPIICFFSIFFNLNKKTEKLYVLTLYFIFSLPYIYLMNLWEGLVPGKAASRVSSFDIENIGYTISIIAFYVFPFFLFKRNITFIFKNFFSNKSNIIILPLIIIYLIIFYNSYGQISLKYGSGNGAFHKIAVILFETVLIQKIFMTFVVSCSALIILGYFSLLKDRLIIFYFLCLSLILSPIYQEYFDPLFFIMLFTFFSEKIEIKKNNFIYVFLYFLVFFISSNYYYIKTL